MDSGFAVATPERQYSRFAGEFVVSLALRAPSGESDKSLI
jgi:hypothetical protein